MSATANRGLRDLTLSDIAQQAEMTRGNLLYYYNSLDDLLIEVHRRAVERFCVRREQHADAHEDARHALAAVIAEGVPRSSDDVLVRVLFEFDALAGRVALHDALAESTFQRQAAMYRRVLEVGQAQGHFHLRLDAAVAARTMVAVEDSYCQLILARSPSVTYHAAVSDLRQLAGTLTDSSITELPEISR